MQFRSDSAKTSTFEFAPSISPAEREALGMTKKKLQKIIFFPLFRVTRANFQDVREKWFRKANVHHF
jgi:hypothetical protein